MVHHHVDSGSYPALMPSGLRSCVRLPCVVSLGSLSRGITTMSFRSALLSPESLMSTPRLALVPSPFCGDCPAAGICRERFTEFGCSPWGPIHPYVLHPSSPDWLQRIHEVNG